MTQQTLDLDRPTRATHGKHHRDAKPTERKAARDVAPKTGTQRAAILAYIVEQDYRGATQWQIVSMLDMLRSSVCARVNELERGGFIEPAGERRSPLNTTETVYRATARGKRWFKSERAS